MSAPREALHGPGGSSVSAPREAHCCPDGYRALSTAELRELLQDDDKMEQILRLNDKFQELRLDRETLQATNRSLAEESLARKPRLLNGKLLLAQKYQQLSNLATQCWEKRSQLEAGGGERSSLQTAQNLLQEEVTRAEEQSEDLLERFMGGHVDLDRFLDSFQTSRRLYHVRRAQAEKLQEATRSRGLKKEVKTDPPSDPPTDPGPPEPPRPNGFVAQGPLRVFQVRYGLTPAILLPHYPVAPGGPQGGSEGPHILSPGAPPHPGPPGQPVGLRVIGQLPGGWPANGRPVRVQQLYRPNPPQPEPPYR